MTTAFDICDLALHDSGVLGVGQTALAEDINRAFLRLNWMISQWRRKRWLIWHLVDVAKVSTGAQSYSVGVGGDFNVAARPDKLEAAFFRQTVMSQPNQIDYPLEILTSREDYNHIALKTLTSFPSYIFYDSAYPLGFVFPWPIPQSAIYEIHLSLKDVLSQFANLTATLNLDDEYSMAMSFNLAVRLRSVYQMEPDPVLMGNAKDSLNLIRLANFQIGRLTMPTDLVRPGVYNPYSDQIR